MNLPQPISGPEKKRIKGKEEKEKSNCYNPLQLRSTNPSTGNRAVND